MSTRKSDRRVQNNPPPRKTPARLDWPACLPAALVGGLALAVGWAAATTTPDQIHTAYTDEAQRAARAGQHQVAKLCFERLALAPDSTAETQFNLAGSLEALGDQRRAVAILGQLAPTDRPGYPAAQLRLAQLLLNEKPTPLRALWEAERHLARHWRASAPRSRRTTLLAANALLAQILVATGRPPGAGHAVPAPGRDGTARTEDYPGPRVPGGEPAGLRALRGDPGRPGVPPPVRGQPRRPRGPVPLGRGRRLPRRLRHGRRRPAPGVAADQRPALPTHHRLPLRGLGRDPEGRPEGGTREPVSPRSWSRACAGTRPARTSLTSSPAPPGERGRGRARSRVATESTGQGREPRRDPLRPRRRRLAPRPARRGPPPLRAGRTARPAVRRDRQQPRLDAGPRRVPRPPAPLTLANLAVERQPDNPLFHGTRGVVLARLGRWKERCPTWRPPCPPARATPTCTRRWWTRTSTWAWPRWRPPTGSNWPAWETPGLIPPHVRPSRPRHAGEKGVLFPHSMTAARAAWGAPTRAPLCEQTDDSGVCCDLVLSPAAVPPDGAPRTPITGPRRHRRVSPLRRFILSFDLSTIRSFQLYVSHAWETMSARRPSQPARSPIVDDRMSGG